LRVKGHNPTLRTPSPTSIPVHHHLPKARDAELQHAPWPGTARIRPTQGPTICWQTLLLWRSQTLLADANSAMLPIRTICLENYAASSVAPSASAL
jgi:hypothetical protein